MPATDTLVDMDVPRNGHFFREFQLTDLAGAAIDLTGHTLAMSARSVPGGTVLASATIAVLEAATGRISIKWTGSAFDSYGNIFETARASYDLKQTYPDGIIDVPFRGYLNIIPESTA